MKFLKTFEEYNWRDDVDRADRMEERDYELEDWQARWDDLMMGMEEEAEPEGGPIADDYSQQMQDMEKEKEEILNKYSDLKSDEEMEVKEDEDWEWLKGVLNYNQRSNIEQWLIDGREDNFIKIRLEFYGITDESEQDKIIELLRDD